MDFKGKRLITRNNLKLIGKTTIQIDKFLLNTFYDGNTASWSRSISTASNFDNFIVYKGKMFDKELTRRRNNSLLLIKTFNTSTLKVIRIKNTSSMYQLLMDLKSEHAHRKIEMFIHNENDAFCEI